MLGYDQSGHIPNVTLSDRQQRASHDEGGILGYAKGFGPWTFHWGEVSRTGGEVSRSTGRLSPIRDSNPRAGFVKVKQASSRGTRGWFVAKLTQVCAGNGNRSKVGIYEVGINIPGVDIDSLVDGWLNVGVHEAQIGRKCTIR